jgi:ketosteroid isomerase-like protein
MGQALDTVRRHHDAFTRQDWDAVFALYHPEAVIDLSRSGIPDAGRYHGHKGLREGWVKWRGAWDSYDVELEDLTELGDRVLAFIHVRASSKGHGIVAEMHTGDVYTVRDGLIVHFANFVDRDDARREAGLG